jgi:DNA-directed RNA polymerase specialized sigma24 family protein
MHTATQLDDLATTLTQARTLLAGGKKDAERGAVLVYERLCPSFERLFAYKCKNDALAQDIAIQAVMRIISNIAQATEPKAIVGWCWTVAWSVFNTQIRKANTIAATEMAMDSDSYDALTNTLHSHSDDSTVHWCLQQQLEKFYADHPDHAAVLQHSAIDGLHIKDIASLLGRTAGATREFISQARQKLVHYWAQCRA